jgi:hypothetical protein
MMDQKLNNLKQAVGLDAAMTKILSYGQLKRLSEHKYSASGTSIIEPLFQPFWKWLVEQVPMWVAPNLLTIAGLILNIVTTLIIVYYSPDAKSEVSVMCVRGVELLFVISHSANVIQMMLSVCHICSMHKPVRYHVALQMKTLYTFIYSKRYILTMCRPTSFPICRDKFSDSTVLTDFIMHRP